MTRKEIIILSAGIGFLIIWIIDLNAPTPVEIQGNFWLEIYFHYVWLMFGLGSLLYFQYSKNMRIKEEEKKAGEPKQDIRSRAMKSNKRKN